MASPRALPPEALDRLIGFLNTLDVENGRDAIGTPEELGAWLARQHGWDDAPTPGPDEHTLALRLRGALRDVWLHHHGGPLHETAVPALNELADEVGFRLRFREDGALVPEAAAGGVGTLLGGYLGAVHDAMTAGIWERVKICQSDRCLWAFYDQSRNQSGRWCSMAVCGNRTKARKYRARQRDEGAEP